MNLNFGKKKTKEPLSVVKISMISSTLATELEQSLSDVLTKEDVKSVCVHLSQFLLDKYKLEEKTKEFEK